MESLGGGEVAMMMEEVGCWVLAGTTSGRSGTKETQKGGRSH